jgi:predicted AlkP superfamily pyrophosphatase or phosphodiesterase
MHVVVISVDALITEDLAYAGTLPSFSRLLSRCDMVRAVMSAYPSYTYPCHATIMTGCWPDRHGVIHNESYPDGKWNWFASSLKTLPMTSAAKAAGLSTCAVAWPVMGGSAVDYLIAEIWAPKAEDDPGPCFDRADSLLARQYFEESRHLLDWMRTPGFDLFATEAFCSIFRDHAPNLSFLHLSYLDHQRHKRGSATEKNLDAIRFVDDRLKDVLSSVEKAGVWDDTVFVLLGDHGHRDTDKVFQINAVLSSMGYGGRITAQSASFSALVYLDGISDSEAFPVLQTIKERYPEYVERVQTREETEKHHHLSGPFSFVLEARSGVVFGEKREGDVLTHPVPGDWRSSLSAHGFAPEKGPFPPFVLSGKGIDGGHVVPCCAMVDEAPTIMSLFGVPFPCDGHPIHFK